MDEAFPPMSVTVRLEDDVDVSCGDMIARVSNASNACRDITTLHRAHETKKLILNKTGRIQLRTTVPLLADPYAKNRTTGSFILVDEATDVTCGAGMINNA